MTYVTRPAKIVYVAKGTLKYLKITNLKYLMPYNFPVPDSNHVIRFKYSKAIATSKQSYNYLLFGFAGFSHMAQNITNAVYKG